MQRNYSKNLATVENKLKFPAGDRTGGSESTGGDGGGQGGDR